MAARLPLLAVAAAVRVRGEVADAAGEGEQMTAPAEAGMQRGVVAEGAETVKFSLARTVPPVVV